MKRPILHPIDLARLSRMLSWYLRRWQHALGLAAAVLALLTAGAVRAQDIVIAHIGPFTGPAASDARNLNAGMRAYFDQVNARGGIGGRQLVLVDFDDRYDGEEFGRQFELAMKRKPIAVLSPLGVGAMRTLLGGKLLDRHDVVVLNAVPGATPFREPGHPRLFHVRASDRQQIEKILRHAHVLGATNMQVIVQDLKAGSADVLGAQEAVGRDKSPVLRIVQAKDDPAELAAAAASTAKSDVQAVLVIGAPRYMATAVDALRKSGARQAVFALSYLSPDLAVNVAGGSGARGLGVSQAYPNPMGHTMPLHREFQKTMRVATPALADYSVFHLEGYLTARVLVEGLKRAPREVTPATLAQGLKAMGEIDLGGFRVDFSRRNTGSRFVDIGVISHAGKLVY